MGCSCQKVRTEHIQVIYVFLTIWYHFRDTKNGGPVHWIHENHVCFKGCNKKTHHCCKNVPEGDVCKADPINEETGFDKNVMPG